MSFFRSDSRCCFHRKPPSPDGFPPRLVVSKSPVFPVSPRDPKVSWTETEAAEMRAIFEEDDKDTDAEIVQVKHNSTKKLKALLLGEDLSDANSEMLNARRYNSSALIAVTRKLKQHLSREALSKRRSKSSVGTSEEEIERRAELRRIRHKRIQEELSNEGLYDEDAYSMDSIPDVNASTNSPQLLSQFSWSPSEVASLSSPSPPSKDSVALALPILPLLEDVQKDIILEKDSTSANASWKSTSRHLSYPIEESSATMVNSSGAISRRHSSPLLNAGEASKFNPAVYVPPRKRSSIIQIPSKPVLEAQRLPSFPEPCRSSWRLSFNANNRGDELRKLSQEHSPVTLERFGVSSLPMRTWLHNQGLRSPSQAITSSEDDNTVKMPTFHAESCTVTSDFGGVDGGVEANETTLHLHEMGISQRLAPSFRGLQSSVSSPQLSSWGSHNRGNSSMSAEFRPFLTNKPRYLQDSSDSDPLSQRLPQSWGKVVQDNTSSFYPSAVNSMQSSPQSSRFDLASRVAANMIRMDAAELRKPPVAYVSSDLASSPSEADSFLDLAPPPTRQSRQPTNDDSSILASETESFQHREAELSIIPKRFASSEMSVPSTPKSSRFREEFDVEHQQSADVLSRKPSRFSKLKKFTFMSFDGTKDMNDVLGIPIPDFAPDELYSSPAGLKRPGGRLLSTRRGSPSTNEDRLIPMTPRRASDSLSTAPDDTASQWCMAIKMQVERDASALGHNLQLPGKDNEVSRKKSAVEKELEGGSAKSVIGQLAKNLSWSKKKKNLELNDPEGTAIEYQKRVQERLAVKELVKDSWEAEMNATEQKAKVQSRNIVKPTGPDRRYPAAWARYPSHSRSERSASAGRRDTVEPQDFAIAKTTKTGESVWYHGEKRHHLQNQDTDEDSSYDEDKNQHPHRQKFEARKDRASDKIKSKMHKLDKIAERGIPNHAHGRRSSIMMAGRLEYPELEMLPITIRTEAQMEEDILEEKARLRKDRGSSFGGVGYDGENENEMGINDPRFYDECVAETEKVFKSERKKKYRTWSGRDLNTYASGKEREMESMRGRTLRRTDAHQSSLLVGDSAERGKGKE